MIYQSLMVPKEPAARFTKESEKEVPVPSPKEKFAIKEAIFSTLTNCPLYEFYDKDHRNNISDYFLHMSSK